MINFFKSFAKNPFQNIHSRTANLNYLQIISDHATENEICNRHSNLSYQTNCFDNNERMKRVTKSDLHKY